ncbi:unnamed protein product, partial [Leptidea sinapis]
TSNLTKVVNINSYDCSLVYNDANETIKQLKFEEHYSSDVEYKSVDTIENNIDINDDDAIINNEHPLFLEIDTDNTSRHTTSKDSNVEQNGVNVSQKWDDIRILWRGRKRRPRARTGFKDSLEDKFVITDLTYEEQLAEVHKRRESANYKNSTYRCTLCFKGFLDEDAFKAHMMRHTRECGEYECGICKVHYKTLAKLYKHISGVHLMRYSCKRCPFTTLHIALARSHDRWHDGKKFHCQHCSQEFNTLTTYMSHLRIKHPTDFVCELCGYSFVSEKGKYQHRSLKHRLDDFQIPDDGPRCEKCNIQFRSDEAYEKHISVSLRHTAAPVANEYRKPSLRKKGIRLAGFRRERVLEEPLSCEQCDVQLNSVHEYNAHFRREHPDKNRTVYPTIKAPCMCEICGRIFQSRAVLRDHRWTHTGETPFRCTDCGKTFSSRKQLVVHEHVHTDERKTFQCGLCAREFSTRGNCRRHMSVHTTVRPHQCELCGKCFKTPHEKKSHCDYVHLKKPWPRKSRGKLNVKDTVKMETDDMTCASEMDYKEE